MLNENIKDLRMKSELTQEQLANKLGVTRQTISKWENGISVPDADVLSHMADILHVSVGELLGLSVEASTNDDYSKVLAMINEELAEKNEHRKKVMKIVKIILILIGAGIGALVLYVIFWMIIAATM